MQPPLWVVLFLNHTAMLVGSLLLMTVLSRGKLARYGFRWPKDLGLRASLLWGVGLGAASALVEAALPGENTIMPGEWPFLQIVALLWLYASVSEEVFMRGLIQSSLSRFRTYGFTLFGTRISLPVLMSALIFGVMHVAQAAMGVAGYQVLVTVVFAFILGLLAGTYREGTDSLVPAIVVHAFANVGGSLVGCLGGWETTYFKRGA